VRAKLVNGILHIQSLHL